MSSMEKVESGGDIQDKPSSSMESGTIEATITTANTSANTTPNTSANTTANTNEEDASQLDASAPVDHSSVNTRESTKPTPDSSDSRWLGKGQPIEDVRPLAEMSVGRNSHEYNMTHKRRGLGLIIAYDHFASKLLLQKRPCARHDAKITKEAFKSLGFEIEEYWNLDKRNFLLVLEQASKQDHSDRDALAVVFMSHGGLDKGTNKEFIWTYDTKVDTSELWKNFTPNKCPSLAGKPKLFFIQACRGEETDKGVQLKRPRGLLVSTDSYVPRDKEEDYVIPQYADMLFMWASYPGMYAFKSSNHGINGSVFLHFLSKVFQEYGPYSDLASMLLRVTREVAIQYESFVPHDRILDQNKQIPYTVSTLMRKIFFFSRKPTAV